MINFVNQDEMTPVQLALETARFELASLHGATVSWTNNTTYTKVLDTSEVVGRIDDALKSLGIKPYTDTH